MKEFNIGFIPDELDEIEEARRQRIANMSDRWPALAQAMHGKTWEEIYRIPMVEPLK